MIHGSNVLYWRLTESDIPVTPHMDWLCCDISMWLM